VKILYAAGWAYPDGARSSKPESVADTRYGPAVPVRIGPDVGTPHGAVVPLLHFTDTGANLIEYVVFCEANDAAVAASVT
jgi:hypothetical protein